MSRNLSLLLCLAGLILVLSACAGTAEATQEAPELQAPEAPQASSQTPEIALAADKNDFFASAGSCVVCHQNIVDEAGNDVSNGEYWRGTMMANAAKDPYYLAGVSINVARYPEYEAAIENKCSTCHMPMAHFSDAAQDREGVISGANGYLDQGHPLHILASDGVSCTTCHQIQDEGLGEFISFSGGGVFDLQTPMGSRVLFGPFAPEPSGQNIMSGGSGFIPQQGEHLPQSELCATCHNLYTHYVAADGTFSDAWFPEQTPYSEWLNSDYAAVSACQDCHMPKAEGGVVISNVGPAIKRTPYSKHSFVGGNAYMLGVLNRYAGELGLQASEEHFAATTDRTLAQLGSQTATLAVTDPVLAGTILSFDVTTGVLTGHKFPTGYPSRRAWLHVTVKDAKGQTIFESGGVNSTGAISGNDNDDDPLAYEPHYEEITSPEQVQIYESIMQDVRGSVTTILLSASAYLKDNRLLPAGFDKGAVPIDIAPVGAALSDADFNGGVDSVTYHVDTGTASGPFTVDVELLYQSIAFRWAQDSRAYDTEPAQAFSAYYSALPNLPVLVASQIMESE